MKPIDGEDDLPEVDIDNQPLKFGKYSGNTPDEISEFDPGYIVWLYEQDTSKVSEAMYKHCNSLVEDSDEFMDELQSLRFNDVHDL